MSNSAFSPKLVAMARVIANAILTLVDVGTPPLHLMLSSLLPLVMQVHAERIAARPSCLPVQGPKWRMAV